MRHAISNIDSITNTADCRVCGRVTVWKKGMKFDGNIRWVCSNKKKQEKSSAHAKMGHCITNWKARGVIITEEEIQAFYEAKKCECCGAENVPLHLDHCHKTGKARGALCKSCNLGLGSFKDDISILTNVISYLERYSQ